MKTKTIKELKKGEYFKISGLNIVYVKDSFNRSTKKYEAYKFEDVNDFRSFKSSQLVTVDFDF